jgi:small subunit ribosomal protein S13
MPRISGVNLPNNKRLEIGLTYIYGIGISRANFIIQQAGLDPNMKCKDLQEDQTNKIRQIIDKNFKIEGELKREVLGNIKRLKEIGSYRGLRHNKKLPARGQRTKTNSRTVRGNIRKTAGSGKKPPAQKT